MLMTMTENLRDLATPFSFLTRPSSRLTQTRAAPLRLKLGGPAVVAAVQVPLSVMNLSQGLGQNPEHATSCLQVRARSGHETRRDWGAGKWPTGTQPPTVLLRPQKLHSLPIPHSAGEAIGNKLQIPPTRQPLCSPLAPLPQELKTKFNFGLK